MVSWAFLHSQEEHFYVFFLEVLQSSCSSSNFRKTAKKHQFENIYVFSRPKEGAWSRNSQQETTGSRAEWGQSRLVLIPLLWLVSILGEARTCKKGSFSLVKFSTIEILSKILKKNQILNLELFFKNFEKNSNPEKNWNFFKNFEKNSNSEKIEIFSKILKKIQISKI